MVLLMSVAVLVEVREALEVVGLVAHTRLEVEVDRLEVVLTRLVVQATNLAVGPTNLEVEVTRRVEVDTPTLLHHQVNYIFYQVN